MSRHGSAIYPVKLTFNGCVRRQDLFCLCFCCIHFLLLLRLLLCYHNLHVYYIRATICTKGYALHIATLTEKAYEIYPELNTSFHEKLQFSYVDHGKCCSALLMTIMLLLSDTNHAFPVFITRHKPSTPLCTTIFFRPEKDTIFVGTDDELREAVRCQKRYQCQPI